MGAQEKTKASPARKRTLRLGCVALATALTALGLLRLEARELESRLKERATSISAHLSATLAGPLESLHAVRSLLQTPGRAVSEADFSYFCEQALRRHPEITSIGWFPFVPGDKRAEFEALVQKSHPNYRIKSPGSETSPTAFLHIPLTYTSPRNIKALGLDLRTNKEEAERARAAHEQGKVTATDRSQLSEEARGTYGVVTYAPVKNSDWALASGGDHFKDGVIALTFRLPTLMDGALAHQDMSGVALRLMDPAAAPEKRELMSVGTLEGAARARATIPFADRVYELTVGSSGRGAPLLTIGAALFVALAGLSWVWIVELRERAQRLSATLATLGQYRLEEQVASGGMGAVYRARHALLKRPAAIKIAHPDQSATHFEREVRLHSTLTHPNTVTVFDFGRGEDGTFYAAMEYIEGYDLSRLVERFGPLPAGRAARILLQVAASLEEAHEKGLVHRDVKPSNIMITERGGIRDFVKVLDFGLARGKTAEAGSLHSLSATTVFVGTPGYIAPEIISGARATPASDIFSLGCVAFFLVSGRGPFDDPNQLSSFTRIVSGAPHPFPSDTPKLYQDFVLRCLEKKPHDRPPRMSAVASELRALIPLLPAWTPEDSARFWREHPPEHKKAEGPVAFSIALRSRDPRSGTSG